MNRLFTAIAVLLTLATAAGLAVLWPGHPKLKLAGGIAVDSRKAKVDEVRRSFCPGPGRQRAAGRHGDRRGLACSTT